MSLTSDSAGWDLPRPYIHSVTVQADDIDDFGHANNSVFLRWADETAWAHWAADGRTRAECKTLDRGMAILRTEADYLGHCRAGDELSCAVWIARSDGRLRAERWYQFRRKSDGDTVFRAITKLVSFQLSTGKPARMLGAFAEHYAKPSEELSTAADRFITGSKR